MRQFLLKAVTPGEMPPATAVVMAYAFIAAILILDSISPNEVSLRILYVFPLALLSIHVANRAMLSIGLATIILGLVYSIFRLPLPISARYTQFLLGTAAFFFVGYLIRLERRHYLEIQRLATHDALTGLQNRQALQLTLEAEIARLHRYGTVFSLAVIDLDRFKLLNDSRGHDQGDAALRLVSQIMSTTTRRTDTLARAGGDEFVLLMPNTGRQDCERTCSMLVEKVDTGMAAAGFDLTVSIGAAAFAEAPESVAHALKKADDAMYLAKNQGKGRAVVV